MRLATVRVPNGTSAVRIEGDEAIALEAPDVAHLLSDPAWREKAASPAMGRERFATELLDYAPVIATGKVICVGLNYTAHIQEMGRELPSYPTLFSKFSEAIIGAGDPIQMPAVSTALDWEGELAVIVGSTLRSATRAEAEQAIAGYSVFNDITVRDYQTRTSQWLQGKSFESTTPLGPWLVTPEEVDPRATLETRVDGELVQRATIDDLVFGAAELLEYASHIVTLRPGDLIATGTPGGVGQAQEPPRYLRPGNVLTTTISGLGTASNPVLAPDTRALSTPATEEYPNE